MADLRYSRSLKRHALVGVVVVVIAGGATGVWASVTQIAGAVVASGQVVTELAPQRIQHPEGGVVVQIAVRNEDHIEAGGLLLRLDDSYIARGLEIIEDQLDEALAKRARLMAESIGAAEVQLDEDVRSRLPSADFSRLIEMQQTLLDSRRTSNAGKASQLAQQIEQLRRGIAGNQAEKDALERRLALLNEHLNNIQDLNTKGLARGSDLNTLRQQVTQVEGGIGQAAAAIASAEASISERQLAISEVETNFRSLALDELQTTNQQIAELKVKQLAESERLSRLQVISPVSGVVHQSVIETVGGVAAAGETLMLIVPDGERLTIDARVSPLDVDKVSPGQSVEIRLSGLNARVAPEIYGTVRSLAPDLTRDPVSGVTYYLARIQVPQQELDKLPDTFEIRAGMPAEVFILTGEKSVVSYLIKPLEDQIERAFRED
jgi:HlyD family secretion protein